VRPQVFDVPITSWWRALTLGPAITLAAGLLTATLLPVLTRWHARLCRLMLAPSAADLLAARVDVLTRTRAGVVDAFASELRRIERDLHDGAQQRLVSIGLALRHAQHQLGGGTPERAGATLDSAVAEIAAAITELRELAQGLPPAQLDAGLAPAFEDLARRAPVPVEVRVPADRYSREVEGAAWFIGCEAVTNAVKHARASRIAVSADRSDGRLVITVADDGVGGATVDGSGLRGLADRVTALGGVLRVDSPAGAGTTLMAELPCGS
jgi:signal transduction histidine kinase